MTEDYLMNVALFAVGALYTILVFWGGAMYGMFLLANRINKLKGERKRWGPGSN